MLIRAAALGMTVSLVCLLLRKKTPELGLALAMAAAVGMGLAALSMSQQLRTMAQQAGQTAGLSAALTGPVLRCVGLGLLSRFACDLCQDAGQRALASAVELVGTMAAMYVSLPLLRSFLDLMEDLL